MPAKNPRFPWVTVSAIAATLLVLAVVGLRIPEAAKVSAKRDSALPLLGLAQIKTSLSADILAEQIAAYDPSPMFVPSGMNSSDPALPDGARSGSAGPFGVLPPGLVKTAPLKFPSPVPIPVSPIAGLRLTERPEAPLALARRDATGEGLTPRAARIEVVRVEDGALALTVDLPAPSALLESDWQPFELMAAVTRAGQVGELVVASSSGSDEIDDFFRSYTQKNLRFGERVKAGFYTLRVGP